MGRRNDLWDPASTDSAVQAARRVRRPLVRVDGPALERLERHQPFLARHVRQFWWQQGKPKGPSRLVVLDVHDIDPRGRQRKLVGRSTTAQVPRVLANIKVSRRFELDDVSAVLDAAWRAYMERRPSNARNLTFGRELVPQFEAVDEEVRRLARSGRLLAPGGRKLLATAERRAP